MVNFTVSEGGHEFKFISMNRRRLQLFQVYVSVDRADFRFHMQIDEATGDFKIAEKAHCPAQFYALEGLLSAAIRQHGATDVIPT